MRFYAIPFQSFLKVWLCGGEVLVAPCSRVGHVFRTRRPYKGKRGLDTSLYNALRTAKVWLGEYYEVIGRE